MWAHSAEPNLSASISQMYPNLFKLNEIFQPFAGAFQVLFSPSSLASSILTVPLKHLE